MQSTERHSHKNNRQTVPAMGDVFGNDQLNSLLE